MSRIVGNKVRQLRLALGESQSEFAERFRVEQATVSRWESGAPVKRVLQESIAALAGMSVSEFFHSNEAPRLIPIVGEISAGEEFVPTDYSPPGTHPDHVRLSLGEERQIALRVRGDSMAPAYRDGDVIIGVQLRGSAMQNAIGRDCLVKTAAGAGYLKVVRPGSKKGVFRLRSYNPLYADIDDVALEWAAPVLWVRRSF
jgi:transcriptional regulator with XRE-family HTH domain